ncbi:MAG: group 1 glycosyl transferase, partial [Gallionella sp.]|nr:group 1 glycosyl transferase [Gallionella sp.]
MTDYNAVHQFHSGVATGDAITNQMLDLRWNLRSLGFKSDIFAEHVDPDLLGEVRYLSDYSCRGHQLLLWHHSMGNDATERLLALPHDIAVVYHNVTPPEFFTDPTAKFYSQLGRAQLQVLALRAKAALADSNFNRIEMLQAGFRRVAVLPPLPNLERFRPRLGEVIRRNHDWLFVGRIVPNKGQVHLVRAFAEFQKTHTRSARLVLVGDQSYEPYVR